MDWKRQLRGVAGAQAESKRRQREPRASLTEVFVSVQGEGRHVGRPCVFVRTATCPLRCLYCDTPDSYVAPERFPVRLGPRRQFEANPVGVTRAAELVDLAIRAHSLPASTCVSLTGGEPLAYPDFVREFGGALRERGARFCLETAAIDPDALDRCIDRVDHLSADYKLPSTLGEPVGGPVPDAGGGYGERHLRCCELALRRGTTVDVKIVLTDAVTDPELEAALERLRPVRSRIVLVLQPVTPHGDVRHRPPSEDLERFWHLALREGFDTLVLPQVHRSLQMP